MRFLLILGLLLLASCSGGSGGGPPFMPQSSPPETHSTLDLENFLVEFRLKKADPYSFNEYVEQNKGKRINWTGMVCQVHHFGYAIGVFKDDTGDKQVLAFVNHLDRSIKPGVLVKIKARISDINVLGICLDECHIYDITYPAEAEKE